MPLFGNRNIRGLATPGAAQPAFLPQSRWRHSALPYTVWRQAREWNEDLVHPKVMQVSSQSAVDYPERSEKMF